MNAYRRLVSAPIRPCSGQTMVWSRGMAYAPRVKRAPPKKMVREVILPKFATVSHLASLLNVRFVDLQRKMDDMGYSDQGSDHIVKDEDALMIADECGIPAKLNENHGDDIFPQPMAEKDDPSVKPRPPVVALMGHVDHGKTTLLDYFRNSNIVDGEKGGITQHIGAFLNPLKTNKTQEVCFLDTPGHEAFLKLRQRGANSTDIVLLVVAADDSVMPQTKEAIKHAKAAGVPMVVAITKADRPDSNPEKVIGDLAAAGVDVEEYGGETQCIPVSAPAKMGMDDLEAALMALVDVLDVQAPVGGNIEGVVVESQQVKGLGAASTIIVRRGTLTNKNVFLVAGTTWAKVRQLSDDRGKNVKAAPPGTPVRVTGWKELPEPGDTILQAKNEEHAKSVVANRKRLLAQALEANEVEVMNENRRLGRIEAEKKQVRDKRSQLGLDDAPELEEGSHDGPRLARYIIKADVGGSAEAVKDSISALGNDEIKASVLYSAVGPVTENDISRAQTANASIIVFATQLPGPMARLAEKMKVPVARYDVIYKAIESVTAELSAQLKPEVVRKVLASAELRQVFKINVKRSHVYVAGVKVNKGSFTLQSLVQVRRGDKTVFSGKLASIQHNRDQIAEARKGSEYGFGFGEFAGLKEGDVIEAYEEHEVPRYL